MKRERERKLRQFEEGEKIEGMGRERKKIEEMGRGNFQSLTS